MCGINGIFAFGDGARVGLEELRRTRDAMANRGPDGAGEWLSADSKVGFGHQRLAIIDLSPQGAQPMASADGRFRITFNGEIYNYRELRASLPEAGRSLRTQSDTEVIMALYAAEGTRAFGRLRGMFTAAIWDARERTLVLARDPLGIKPLYYTHDADTLRFASQVKALLAGGAVPRTLEPAGIVGYLLWGSVPEPHTWVRGVRALPAGHSLTLTEGGRVGEPVAYPIAAAESSNDVAALLGDSVRAHLVADVPVGVFLSAGLDSSLLAALAQRESKTPIRTFTVTFAPWRGTARDEAPLAARIAETLGTQHEEHVIDRAEFQSLWSEHLAAMDQPSIDGFNTYLVSRPARKAGLKVVLSGLGGDELFGSYSSFTDVPRWRRGAALLAAIPGARSAWPSIARTLRPGQPKLAGLAALGGTLPGAYFLRRGLFLPDEVRRLLPQDIAEPGLAAYDPLLDARRPLAGLPPSDDWLAVHAMESALYMRNQLLRDSDWASMAHGLELRVPLVDAHLERALARLDYEPGRSLGKAAAIALAAPELPREVFSRQKSGFAVPLEWLEAMDGGVQNATGGSLRARRVARRVAAHFDLPLEAMA
ncbi:MAG: asparagine synthase (glutamine-hydrolyzing) [Acidobacteriota bacterium]